MAEGTAHSPKTATRAESGTIVASVLAAVVLLASFFAWRGVLELPLFGWDAYPLIASARVHGLGDVGKVFTSELMDGRYPLGDFYRPLVQLSFALDRALWGVEPWGYHVTDLVIWSATSLAVFLLARTLFGPRAHVAALFAGLFFALHPLGWEVLPAPARRADLLAVCFGVAAFACVPGATSKSRVRAVCAALFAWLAFASKESGVIVAPLLALFYALSRAEGSFVARAKAGLGFALPALVLWGGFLAARFAVLGGLGGGARVRLAGALDEMHETMARAAAGLFPPFGTDVTAHAADLATVIAIVALVGAAVALSHTRGAPNLAERRPLTGLLVWASLLIFLTGIAGDKRAWYALPFLPIVALMVGYVAEHGLALQRRGSKIGGSALVGLAALVLAYPARSGGLFRPTPDSLVVGAREINDFLARFDVQVRMARVGQTVTVEALRPELVYVANERERRLALHTDYSVRAYAELMYPQSKLRVERNGSTPPAPAAADELVVLLSLQAPSK
ncbi:MAG: hypothetical protein K8S98_05315 [Planctomycetes bacterium]|nr:hypothetical protein [Planctomycetota bacterium]